MITVLNEIVAGIAGAWQRIGELGVKPGEYDASCDDGSGPFRNG